MNKSVPTQATTPDADFFRTLEIKRTQALVARDIPAIEKLHASDYELISPPGRVMTRERYLLGMAVDNAVTSYCLTRMGERGAFVFFVYLFITFGKRFSLRAVRPTCVTRPERCRRRSHTRYR